jgi:pimeloyl-ACP methyl ester carboxylesterase
MAVLPLFVLSSCGGPARNTALAPPQDFFLSTADGVQLTATLYPVRAPNPPGLVLVHMLGSNRGAWQPFALRAQQLGYLCIAFDLRGHGQSVTRNGETISYRAFDTDAWLAALYDIDAARQALIEHGTNPDNLAVIGADIGANLALHYALQREDVPAVVLVSPGLDYKGIKTETQITEYGKRPVLLVTSEGDTYSASSCRALKRLAPGLCEIREYPGAAHGAAIFDASATALEEVFLWLRPIIGPKDLDKASRP